MVSVIRYLRLVFVICTTISAKSDMNLIYEWSELDFSYDSPEARQRDIDSGLFIPGVPVPIDVDVHYNNETNQTRRVFVTTTKFLPGIPATLGTIIGNANGTNPLIKPFPSWDWQTNPELCKIDRIVSVLRIFIDECERLWVLDTGRLLNEIICPPQILSFDLRTDKLIHRYEIPYDQYQSVSIFSTIIADVRGGECADTFVYAADCRAFSIMVYDVQNNVSWIATDRTMYPYPNYGSYDILGDRFDLMDGVLGMALEPYKPGKDRKLFYHALSSPTENWVYTSDLRNQTRFLYNAWSSPEIFHTYTGERRTQSAAEAISREGIMFFGLMSDVTIDCWNIHTSYGLLNIHVVDDNHQRDQFVSGVKIVTQKDGSEELWVLTTPFQRIDTHTLNLHQMNFFIQVGNVKSILHASNCTKTWDERFIIYDVGNALLPCSIS